MKTAEEILGNFGIGVNIKFGKYKFLYETLKNMVEHTQKEAYSQAIEDATERADKYAEEAILAVSKSFTVEEVVNELEDCDTLDDAIMFFKEQT